MGEDMDTPLDRWCGQTSGRQESISRAHFGVFAYFRHGIAAYLGGFWVSLHTELLGFTRYRSLIEVHSSSNIALSHQRFRSKYTHLLRQSLNTFPSKNAVATMTSPKVS